MQLLKKYKDFSLYKIEEKIYCLTFKYQYDAGMHFCRLQEFYESPNAKFRNKSFDIFDLMRWYSLEKSNGYFSYPQDWRGYNLPSYVFDKAFKNVDLNKFDKTMLKINKFIKNYQKSDKYYLIGTIAGDAHTLDHELAHAFFYIYPKYKKEMLKLVNKLSKKSIEQATDWLKEIGYTPKVYKDELQAYIATDNDSYDFCNNFNISKKIEKEFRDLWDKYNKG